MAESCRLGCDIAERLFGNEVPLNRELEIDDECFLVIGVMEPHGTFNGQNLDEVIFIPVTTAQRRFTRRVIVRGRHRDQIEAASKVTYPLTDYSSSATTLLPG
jgi:putative ABC transport system permease protein